MLAVCSVPISPIVRPLTADDESAYRTLRQKILVTGDGRYFSDSYTREAQLNKNQWPVWCTETPEHCILGIFDQSRLIGILMITRVGEIEDRTVEWEAIWLDPQYRKQGIAKLAYEQAQVWTYDHGYDHVVLYIRADNARSLEIHRKHGARYVSTKPTEIWADGSVADTRVFVLNIRAFMSEQSQQKTLRYLESTLQSRGNKTSSIEETIEDRIAHLDKSKASFHI